MKNKKLTINDLARMVQKGFNETDEKIDKLATKEELKSLATKEELKSLATKNELKSLENKFDNFKSETLTNFDNVLNKLDILIEDKDIRNYQDEQKKKFYGIVVNHMETGKTTPEQLEEISKLNVL